MSALDNIFVCITSNFHTILCVDSRQGYCLVLGNNRIKRLNSYHVMVNVIVVKILDIALSNWVKM